MLRIKRHRLALSFLIAIFIVAGCATIQFPIDYYPTKNVGDTIASALRLGMTIDEIRTTVSASEVKGYVEEGSGYISTEDEILRLYTYAQYPKGVLTNLKVGTVHRWYRFWITANSQASLDLFFDESGRLRGWANYPSRFNYEKYWHERMTSKLKVRDGTRGMTRGEVHDLFGRPLETIELPLSRSPSQYDDHVWLSYSDFGRAPIRDVVEKLDVYSYPTEGGSARRVYLGYREYPRYVYQFVSKQKPREPAPNPKYVGPEQDELEVWGYDRAWEEGERYVRTAQGNTGGR